MAYGSSYFYKSLNGKELLFHSRPSTMKSSKCIGDEHEIKKTFFFHTDERFVGFVDLFRLFVHMGRIFFYGIHVVSRTIVKPCRLFGTFRIVERLYVEKRA
ncbi:hypothetical protein SAMN04487936_105297 [Halobacillus dabanensis]|uniref:Uncharacterized protein n=1 Tax=Halobacillus dabanensis TaxID=240302 RepID=A0A1I3VGC2_HALDA|nr:hypothetical protein SAMN04487936_105297 [Halobacillus dabanensis]